MRQIMLSAMLLCLMLSLSQQAYSQGVMMNNAGAVGRSFGGATTAAPLDAASALYWNPAAIGGLGHSEVMFGSEFIYADANLASSIPAGALGGGLPATDRSGVTHSDGGVAALPTIAWVHHDECSPITLGVGVFAPMGASVNYAGSATQPLLTPQNPPTTFGFGPQYSSAALFSTMPTVSLQLTDQLIIGAGVTIDSLLMSLDPAFFAPRNANGTFPAATHGRSYWGGSFRAGALYTPNKNWNIGLSYQSKRWFETLKWNSSDENGTALPLSLEFELPQIVSIGAAYKGIPGTIIAADVRWFDYANTATLGDPVVAGGTNWNSIWAVSVGAQRQIVPGMTGRVGYQYGQNPVKNVLTLFNTQLPGIIQHQISVGVTNQIFEKVSTSLAYIYALESEVSGPLAVLPGSSVGMDVSSHNFAFSLNFNY